MPGETLRGLKPHDRFRAAGPEGKIVEGEKRKEQPRYLFFDLPVKTHSLVMGITDTKANRIGIVPDDLRELLQTGKVKVEDVAGRIDWYRRDAATENRAVPVPAAA